MAVIEKMGRRAVVARCDVSDPPQIRELFRRLDAEFGRIDFLGNVAGDGILGTPEEIPLEDVERSWRNLVLGRFAMCQEAGRRMLAAGRGSIVNIGSLASVTALGRGHIA
jgi:NAD(P)-dependent dehydrogenase (short-subunit alcohol dehydrogenase family)